MSKSSRNYWYNYVDINKILTKLAKKSDGNRDYVVIEATTPDNLQTLTRVNQAFYALREPEISTRDFSQTTKEASAIPAKDSLQTPEEQALYLETARKLKFESALKPVVQGVAGIDEEALDTEAAQKSNFKPAAVQEVAESVVSAPNYPNAAVIPINLGTSSGGIWYGNHWVGLVIKKSGGIFHAFYNDSFGTQMEDSFPTEERAEFCTLKQILVNHGVTVDNITDFKAKQQKNGYDCGPWTILNLDSIARTERPAEANEASVIAQRSEFFRYIPPVTSHTESALAYGAEFQDSSHSSSSFADSFSESRQDNATSLVLEHPYKKLLNQRKLFIDIICKVQNTQGNFGPKDFSEEQNLLLLNEFEFEPKVRRAETRIKKLETIYKIVKDESYHYLLKTIEAKIRLMISYLKEEKEILKLQENQEGKTQLEDKKDDGKKSLELSAEILTKEIKSCVKDYLNSRYFQYKKELDAVLGKQKVEVQENIIKKYIIETAEFLAKYSKYLEGNGIDLSYIFEAEKLMKFNTLIGLGVKEEEYKLLQNIMKDHIRSLIEGERELIKGLQSTDSEVQCLNDKDLLYSFVFKPEELEGDVDRLKVIAKRFENLDEQLFKTAAFIIFSSAAVVEEENLIGDVSAFKAKPLSKIYKDLDALLKERRDHLPKEAISCAISNRVTNISARIKALCSNNNIKNKLKYLSSELMKELNKELTFVKEVEQRFFQTLEKLQKDCDKHMFEIYIESINNPEDPVSKHSPTDRLKQALYLAKEHSFPVDLKSTDLSKIKWKDIDISIDSEWLTDLQKESYIKSQRKEPSSRKSSTESIQSKPSASALDVLSTQDKHSSKLPKLEFSKELKEADILPKSQGLDSPLEAKAKLFVCLKALGDDIDLTKHGDDYCYSITDGIRLLVDVRKHLLNYTNTASSEEGYFSLRENLERIFITDPYHIANFEKSFSDNIMDISGKITIFQEYFSNKRETITERTIKNWKEMPKLIVIPILYEETQWRCLVIDINYDDKSVHILRDDPYGKGKFPEISTEQLEVIRVNVEKLIKRQFNDNDFVLTQDKIIQYEKELDQQGVENKGSGSGSIVFSNIMDYVTHYKEHENIEGISYTIQQISERGQEVIASSASFAELLERFDIGDTVEGEKLKDQISKLNPKDFGLLSIILKINRYYTEETDQKGKYSIEELRAAYDDLVLEKKGDSSPKEATDSASGAKFNITNIDHSVLRFFSLFKSQFISFSEKNLRDLLKTGEADEESKEQIEIKLQEQIRNLLHESFIIKCGSSFYLQVRNEIRKTFHEDTTKKLYSSVWEFLNFVYSINKEYVDKDYVIEEFKGFEEFDKTELDYFIKSFQKGHPTIGHMSNMSNILPYIFDSTKSQLVQRLNECVKKKYQEELQHKITELTENDEKNGIIKQLEEGTIDAESLQKIANIVEALNDFEFNLSKDKEFTFSTYPTHEFSAQSYHSADISFPMRNVIVIGPTGSGKSTIINGLLGNKLIKEGTGIVVDPSTNRPYPEIGNNAASSQTDSVTPYKSQDERFTYWDCPGFFDSHGSLSEIRNASILKQLQSVISKDGASIVMTIQWSEVDDVQSTTKFKGFKDSLKQLSRYFNANDIADKMLLVFTKQSPDQALVNELSQLTNTLIQYHVNRTDTSAVISRLSAINQRMSNFAPSKEKFLTTCESLHKEASSQSYSKFLELFQMPEFSEKIVFTGVITAEGDIPARHFNPIITCLNGANLTYGRFNLKGFSISDTPKVETSALGEILNSYAKFNVKKAAELLNERLKAELEDLKNIDTITLKDHLEAKLSSVSSEDKEGLVEAVSRISTEHSECIKVTDKCLRFLHEYNDNIESHVDTWKMPLQKIHDLYQLFTKRPQESYNKAEHSLLLTSPIIGISEVEKKIESIVNLKSIYLASYLLIVDQNANWRGINLKAISYKWKVIGEKKTINLSGYDGTSDSKDGKEGGNFYGYTKEPIAGAELTINLSGGKGYDGVFDMSSMEESLRRVEEMRQTLEDERRNFDKINKLSAQQDIEALELGIKSIEENLRKFDIESNEQKELKIKLDHTKAAEQKELETKLDHIKAAKIFNEIKIKMQELELQSGFLHVKRSVQEGLENEIKSLNVKIQELQKFHKLLVDSNGYLSLVKTDIIEYEQVWREDLREITKYCESKRKNLEDIKFPMNKFLEQQKYVTECQNKMVQVEEKYFETLKKMLKDNEENPEVLVSINLIDEHFKALKNKQEKEGELTKTLAKKDFILPGSREKISTEELGRVTNAKLLRKSREEHLKNYYEEYKKEKGKLEQDYENFAKEKSNILKEITKTIEILDGSLRKISCLKANIRYCEEELKYADGASSSAREGIEKSNADLQLERQKLREFFGEKFTELKGEEVEEKVQQIRSELPKQKGEITKIEEEYLRRIEHANEYEPELNIAYEAFKAATVELESATKKYKKGIDKNIKLLIAKEDEVTKVKTELIEATIKEAEYAQELLYQEGCLVSRVERKYYQIIEKLASIAKASLVFNKQYVEKYKLSSECEGKGGDSGNFEFIGAIDKKVSHIASCGQGGESTSLLGIYINEYGYAYFRNIKEVQEIEEQSSKGLQVKVILPFAIGAIPYIVQGAKAAAVGAEIASGVIAAPATLGISLAAVFGLVLLQCAASPISAKASSKWCDGPYSIIKKSKDGVKKSTSLGNFSMNTKAIELVKTTLEKLKEAIKTIYTSDFKGYEQYILEIDSLFIAGNSSSTSFSSLTSSSSSANHSLSSSLSLSINASSDSILSCSTNLSSSSSFLSSSSSEVGALGISDIYGGSAASV